MSDFETETADIERRRRWMREEWLNKIDSDIVNVKGKFDNSAEKKINVYFEVHLHIQDGNMVRSQKELTENGE